MECVVCTTEHTTDDNQTDLKKIDLKKTSMSFSFDHFYFNKLKQIGLEIKISNSCFKSTFVHIVFV